MLAARSMYPPIDPYQTGMLDVGDGHKLYYERVGTPGGKPAVLLHGGPGSGIIPEYRRFFDPSTYDVMLFDQRGCGQSTPHAELNANTTWHLVIDIEKLREIVGVEKWLVFGGSWGSTLALAYAQKYPQRVSELILRGVYTLTKAELNWYYQFGVSEIFPEKWEKFQAPIPVEERNDMIAAYRKRLISTDPKAQLEAAKAWTIWEGETITLFPNSGLSTAYSDARFALAFALLENHYFSNNCWMEDGQLLRDAHRLSGIPGDIIHGRYDMPCPVKYAYQLHRVWPDAEFHLVEGAGHAATEPGIVDQLIRATDKYR